MLSVVMLACPMILVSYLDADSTTAINLHTVVRIEAYKAIPASRNNGLGFVFENGTREDFSVLNFKEAQDIQKRVSAQMGKCFGSDPRKERK